MRKLSPAMERALDELKRVDTRCTSGQFVHPQELNLSRGWRISLAQLSAREATLDALVRRGLAEVKMGKLYNHSIFDARLYRLAQKGK